MFETYVIKQQKEWGEILTNFEMKNRYIVCDESGAEVFYAGEEGGSFLARMFLRSLRPFTMRITHPNGEVVLVFKRSFRFMFHHMEILSASFEKIGSIDWRFSILTRKYDILDSSGSVCMNIEGPLFHPWTFHIKKQGQEVGKILKKWSGLGKEMFTDADTFALSLEANLEANEKSLLLGAVFLIDFVHFEDNVRRN